MAKVLVVIPAIVGIVITLVLAGCFKNETRFHESSATLETIVETRIPGDMMQMPDYQAGCEIVSVVNALHAFGIEVTFDEAYSYFDISNDDFVNCWWGSPYSQGAAYPPAVSRALTRALYQTGYHAQNTSFETVEDLFHHLKEENGIVIVWYTTDYREPIWVDWEIEGYRMYTNEHCMVLYDIADSHAYVSDPLRGYVEIPIGEFKHIWTACGALAVTIS